MKAITSNNFINSHAGERRADRRFAEQFSFRRRGKTKKNYFVLSNEIIEMHRNRKATKISAVDVIIFSYLSSLTMCDYNGYKGVKVTQKKIALRCGVTEATVSKSVGRLYKAGFITNVITEIRKHSLKRFKTSIYSLKPLPERLLFLPAPNFLLLHAAEDVRDISFYVPGAFIQVRKILEQLQRHLQTSGLRQRPALGSR